MAMLSSVQCITKWNSDVKIMSIEQQVVRRCSIYNSADKILLVINSDTSQRVAGAHGGDVFLTQQRADIHFLDGGQTVTYPLRSTCCSFHPSTFSLISDMSTVQIFQTTFYDFPIN